MVFMKEKITLAKLVYMYILQNPGCTANEIASYISQYGFGFKSSYNTYEVASIIRIYSREEHNNWFNVFSKDVNHTKTYYHIKFKESESE